MIDKDYITRLNDEIEHNCQILLMCIENDTVLTLEQLWHTNIKMIQHLEFCLQII